MALCVVIRDEFNMSLHFKPLGANSRRLVANSIERSISDGNLKRTFGRDCGGSGPDRQSGGM